MQIACQYYFLQPDIGTQNFLDFGFGFGFWNPNPNPNPKNPKIQKPNPKPNPKNPKNPKTKSKKIQNFWIFWIPKFLKLSFLIKL